MSDFNEVYAEYYKDVYQYALSLCGNAAVAEDITSEAFLKAVKAVKNFRGECHIRVWLCQIVKNTYFTICSKNKNTDELTGEIQAPNKDLELALADRETAAEVHEILHRLDEPYKEVFLLRTFGELPFREIAKLFDKTENWACVVYHRAKTKIREALQ